MLDITDSIDSPTFGNIAANRPASLDETGSGTPAADSSWNTWDLIALSELSTFFQAGELVTRLNDMPESLYVVGSGAVKSFYLDAQGNECITAFYLPGEIFGLEGFNRTNLSFAHQMLKTGYLYRIPYREIFHALNKDVDCQKYILQLLSHEMFEAQRMSVINGHYTAEVRLAYFLLNLWQRLNPKEKQGAVFSLPMTRVAISNFLGLTPETISRCFALFKRNNWIEAAGSKIKLTDIESLSHLVTGIPTR
ncbi:Crp/Fnr family transcriptional regulator [Marinobacter subterrani]|uniref:cAMP-binding domain of CRP or a regulatory subunit of cAMP-dependent protein kinase n=1 Tax=Marinobacter subterrani TaxID=1658765 RepID=A0A0J7JE43_9GAMM|nr:helix-turn-helix domain-containing protein [Marinobacter subterrani]KMQ76139.1 cAMP-binding domain of CRP or a regulatory subunit of cAMP-dependent protein kinase [Marinobacter subterrani]